MYVVLWCLNNTRATSTGTLRASSLTNTVSCVLRLFACSSSSLVGHVVSTTHVYSIELFVSPFRSIAPSSNRHDRPVIFLRCIWVYERDDREKHRDISI